MATSPFLGDLHVKFSLGPYFPILEQSSANNEEMNVKVACWGPDPAGPPVHVQAGASITRKVHVIYMYITGLFT